MFKLIIFVAMSGGIVFVSWSSLRDRRSHGFFRFFAFESMLVLFLLAVDHWFSDPLSSTQIVSWLLLLSSLIVVVHAFYLLRTVGRPKGGIESTTTLVTRGAYRYIRHPAYTSLLLFAWGMFFKSPSLLSVILVTATSAFLIATARVEEVENLHKFGTEYAVYIKKTKRFIPFLY